MGFGGALAAMSAVKGVNSIMQGYSQNAEDKYNASLYTDQAQLIAEQGQITQGQYTRKAGQYLSTQIADTAAKGLEPTGSNAAVMVDTGTQIRTDAAIAQFNTTMGINEANAKATALKQQGQNAIFSGYSSAFSDALSGVSSYAMYNAKQPSTPSSPLPSQDDLTNLDSGNLLNFKPLTLPGY